jgi:preprotein translocase subunit SecD
LRENKEKAVYMSKLSIIKNPRIAIWLFFIVISIILIAPNPNPQGFVVKSAGVSGLAVNDVIYKINDQAATQDSFLQTYAGVVKVDTNHGTKFLRVNNTLDIVVDAVQPTNLKFGLDIKGGVRTVLQPNTTSNNTVEQIIGTLQTRINVYGLREATFRATTDPITNAKFIEISIAGGTQEELKTLLENQGKFEAKIPFILRLQDTQAVLKLDKDYPVARTDNTISLNDKTLSIGDSVDIAGINFLVTDITGSAVNMTSTVFSGTDIKTVFFDPQRSRIELTDNGYRWTFAVQLSSEGAQKFAWVTSNINIVPNGYLESPIVFYLDNKYIDSLSISSGLKGRVEPEIAISGSAVNQNQAIETRTQLQSILRSGALPTSVEIVSLDTISPTLGAGFLRNAMIAGLAAILGVILVVSVRYKKPKLVVPMLAISLSEALIILGVSVLIGWTIDLAAIAGIIASVGTGVNSQIIILDRALRKEEAAEESLTEKIKHAFFVIFGSAGTLIAAMLPLMILGFGLLRGFAIVTIIGVLVGVIIARPAYGVIVQRLMK